MKSKIIINVIFIMMFYFNGCSVAQDRVKINTTTVKNVDISKYIGRWYEIARFDHSFERGLEAVTATYTFRSDGKIDVLNMGYKNSSEGKISKAKGVAKIPDKNNPGHLKVSFFLFFYADYFILELDKNYEWALVGSSSPNYLWILCRTPWMYDDTYKMILNKARERGYDVTKLIKVKQYDK